jgi:NitT/TauT family transport system substrate-binding protein
MQPTFRTFRQIAIASGLLFSLASQHATAADDSKITIMVGGITKLIYLPARLTEQLGYFK